MLWRLISQTFDHKSHIQFDEPRCWQDVILFTPLSFRPFIFQLNVLRKQVFFICNFLWEKNSFMSTTGAAEACIVGACVQKHNKHGKNGVLSGCRKVRLKLRNTNICLIALPAANRVKKRSLNVHKYNISCSKRSYFGCELMLCLQFVVRLGHYDKWVCPPSPVCHIKMEADRRTSFSRTNQENLQVFLHIIFFSLVAKQKICKYYFFKCLIWSGMGNKLKSDCKAGVFYYYIAF